MKLLRTGFFALIIVAAFIFVLQYTFNHINPWVSIVLLLVGIYILIEIIINHNKKPKKQ